MLGVPEAVVGGAGWVRCFGCGKKRKSDCIRDGPGEANELPRV